MATKRHVPKFHRAAPAVRREALVDATLRCLKQFGHEGVSVRRISAAAGRATAGQSACWIDNGAVIEMEGVAPCKTREEFVAVLKAQGGKSGFLSLHTGNNPQIKITGAVHAEATWDALFVAVDVADRLTYQLTGQYDNRYVKRNDRWYIQVQKFRQTSLLIKKIAEDGTESVVTFGLPDSKVFDK